MQHELHRNSSKATSITVFLVTLALVGVVLTGPASAGQPEPVMAGGVPADTDCDGLYEDVNGDGEANVVDVQAMFVNRDAIAQRSDATMFDVNEDGSVNVVDVQAMFVDRDASASSLDLCRIEQRMHHYINEERTDRGLDPMNFDTELAQVARYHSEDMAEHTELDHTGSDGSTFQDRYEAFGYECRVPLSDTRYAIGAENIVWSTYEASNTEDDIARSLVDLWMNSEGHKANILTEYWNNEGIGLSTTVVDGRTRIYATQNFC